MKKIVPYIGFIFAFFVAFAFVLAYFDEWKRPTIKTKAIVAVKARLKASSENISFVDWLGAANNFEFRSPKLFLVEFSVGKKKIRGSVDSETFKELAIGDQVIIYYKEGRFIKKPVFQLEVIKL